MYFFWFIIQFSLSKYILNTFDDEDENEDYEDINETITNKTAVSISIVSEEDYIESTTSNSSNNSLKILTSTGMIIFFIVLGISAVLLVTIFVIYQIHKSRGNIEDGLELSVIQVIDPSPIDQTFEI